MVGQTIAQYKILGKLGDGSRPSLSVRADVIRGHAKNRYRAGDPSFTTCTYDRPHTRSR